MICQFICNFTLGSTKLSVYSGNFPLPLIKTIFISCTLGSIRNAIQQETWSPSNKFVFPSLLVLEPRWQICAPKVNMHCRLCETRTTVRVNCTIKITNDGNKTRNYKSISTAQRVLILVHINCAIIIRFFCGSSEDRPTCLCST